MNREKLKMKKSGKYILEVGELSIVEVLNESIGGNKNKR